MSVLAGSAGTKPLAFPKVSFALSDPINLIKIIAWRVHSGGSEE
jgi:hypothetical protein